MDDPIQGDQLISIVERIERLEEEKKTISDDIKEVYAEAKANGYDVKVLRKVVALRKMDANERAEFEAILDLYMQAVGEYADTPLGRAAAPDFSSRPSMARSAPSNSERVSRPAESAGVSPSPTDSEIGTLRGSSVAQTLEHDDVDRSASAPPHSAIGEPAISSTAGDAGTGPALCDEAALAATTGQPSEAGIGSAVRAGAPISGLAAANAIALRAVQPKPASPARDLSGDMPDIPAFLLRPFNGAHPSFGEQE